MIAAMTMELVTVLFELAVLLVRLAGNLFFTAFFIYLTWKILTGHNVSISLDIRDRK